MVTEVEVEEEVEGEAEEEIAATAIAVERDWREVVETGDTAVPTLTRRTEEEVRKTVLLHI